MIRTVQKPTGRMFYGHKNIAAQAFHMSTGGCAGRNTQDLGWALSQMTHLKRYLSDSSR